MFTASQSPKTQSRLLLALLFMVTSAFTTAALAEPETRIYQLNNRTADDVSQQVSSLYQGTAVNVTARGRQLVVRGEPRILDEIGMLISTLDVPPIQMRISVRYQQNIGGKQSGGGVSISSGQANVQVERRTISTSSSTERQLVVQDGQSAHITSGNVRSLPFAVQGGRNPALILEQVDTRSGFVVSPQAISDQAVELSIVSFEEDPAALPGYETEALMTVRRVQPGQWVSLGGTRTHEARERDGITYRVTGRQAENQSIDVKVDILP